VLKNREAARQAKDWAAADLLRKQLQDLGYEVTDTKEGQQLFKL
jgi:cysteinyl-tRNA synthetase